MTRRRWIQKAGIGLVEVPTDHRAARRVAPAIHADLPGYQSPVTGQWIEGRRARREDLKRTGSRPWEGMDQERKEASRQQAYVDEHFDRKAGEAAERAWYQLDPEKRRVLE